jgi:probable addiction module antidote protein
MSNRTDDFKKEILKSLQDPKLREAYVNAALEDGDPKILLSVLEDCVQAVGGIPKIAKEINLSRQAVNKMFSEKGNPRWDNLAKLLTVFGFRLKVSLTSKKELAHA